MNLVRLYPIALGLAAMMFAVPTPRALAFDPTGNAVADAFLAGVEAAGAQTLSVTKVEESGETIVLSGFAAEMLEDGEKATWSADALAFSNATVDASGRIKAGAMAMDKVTIKADDDTFSAARMTATNVRFASPEEMRNATKAAVDAFGYESVELSEIEITSEDEGTVPIQRILSTIDATVDGIPSKGSFEIEGIEIDPKQIDDKQTKETLAELGYAKLVLSMKTRAEWDIDNGRGILEVLEISGGEIGRFAISAAVGGLTRDVVEKLKRQNNEDGEILALLQQITIESIDIRFDNDTVVERVLDRQAKEANMDRAAFVQRMTTSLPQILALLQNPPFQQKVSSALAMFLNEPKNMSVKASPAQPVPVGAVVGTAMAAPAAVPVLLGIEVLANQ